MDIKAKEEFQLLIRYADYCKVTNQAVETNHEWFEMDQQLALSIIYKNMTQTHIFPVDKAMFKHMKDQYKLLFIKALSWQIKYVNDNQELYDNPTGYMSSRQIGTFNRGALSPNEIDKLLNVLAPKAQYYLERMGWLYKSLTDQYEWSQFYDATIDDDYATESYVNEKFDLANDYTDLSVNALQAYTDTKLADKISLLGNEAVSGQPYHIPYHIADLRFDSTDSKLKANLMTITLDNNKTLVNYPLEVEIPTGGGVSKAYVDAQDQAILTNAKDYTDLKVADAGKVQDVKVNGTSVVGTDKVANIDLTSYAKTTDVTSAVNAEKVRAEGVETNLTSAINAEKTRAESIEAGKMDLLGTEAGSGGPYNLMYYISTNANGEKILVNAKTITLDNNKTLGNYSLTVTGATNTTAGLMTAGDKVALGNKADNFTVDGTTITMSAARELSANIPAVMTFKGSETYVSVVIAKTGANVGDVWYAEKDDRTVPQASAPVVNALIVWDGTNWVYAGSTSIDMSTFLTKTEAAATYGLKTDVESHTTQIATLTSDLGSANDKIQQNANDIATLNTNKQDVITSTSKLSAALVDDSSSTNKFVTTAEKSGWDAKQTALTTEQLAACNSGINSTLVAAIPTSTSKLDPANINFSTAQQNALSSGIDSTKVSTYDGYATGKSKVSVSSTGTATDTVSYITVDGVEKKLAGGGSAPTNMVTTDTAQDITGAKTFKVTEGSYNGSISYSYDSYGKGTSIDLEAPYVDSTTMPTTFTDVKLSLNTQGINLEEKNPSGDTITSKIQFPIDQIGGGTLVDTIATLRNCKIITYEPTEAANYEGIHIAYLETEPTTYYNGWIYLIKE